MSKGMRWTQEQLDEHWQKRSREAPSVSTVLKPNKAPELLVAPKPPKYRNTKTIFDGIKFDSILEAEYFKFLKGVRVWGLIDNIHRQVPLRLEGGVRLVVDFYCTKRVGKLERVWWDDCKGFLTPGASNKLKMVKDRYNIDVRLIKRGMMTLDLFKPSDE